MKRQPRTLRQVINGAVVTTVGFAVGFGATALVLGGSPVDMTNTPAAPSDRANVQISDSPAGLIAEHDCWTGEAPADMDGVIPGAVVVTEPGHIRPTYGGPALVEDALAQIFEGVDHGLRIHAFCEGSDLR